MWTPGQRVRIIRSIPLSGVYIGMLATVQEDRGETVRLHLDGGNVITMLATSIQVVR